jgi:hypothetical protein
MRHSARTLGVSRLLGKSTMTRRDARKSAGLAAAASVLAIGALAVPAQADVTPGALSFGPQPLATTSAPKSMTVRCPATVTAFKGSRVSVQSCAVIGVELSGQDADFAVDAPGGCAGTLSPHDACTIDATFTPSACGPRAATVTITELFAIGGGQFVQTEYSLPLRGRGLC